MDSESGRIESWKAIADYIHCDPTSAMRWERERGLPIYRLQGKRSVVYAFRKELDEWLEQGRRKSPDDRGHAEVKSGPKVAWPLRKVILSVVALVVFGLLARWVVTGRNGTPHVAGLRVDGATLVALDAANHPLWRREFSGPFLENAASGQELVNRSWIGDLRGQGGSEVLFLARQPSGQGLVEDTLYCFDAAGQELWSFRLRDTFMFREGAFGPPWHQGVLSVLDVRGKKRIALALAHSVWWAAPVVTLDADGRRLATFVSSGLIYQMRTVAFDGRPLILAAGTSNSRAAASLIVLDAEAPSGSTPEDPGSPFECLSCPSGRPLRYFSFAKSELATAVKRPYNRATGIRASSDDVLVSVLEVDDSEGGRRNEASTLYHFDRTFRLIDIRWSDGFTPVHKALEEVGVLHHTSESCPNLLPRVREFDPRRGLVELQPRGTSLRPRAGSSGPR